MANFHSHSFRCFGTDSRSQYRSCGFGYPFICIAVCPLVYAGRTTITALENDSVFDGREALQAAPPG